ncbi:MAG: hypothetical protein KBC90_13940 [Spirochaetes bacterium]|nr:hypothetical protein [Spirochaetota bacterium]HOD16467.1 hypothetical protein [Spirochaetota bacterium]HPG50185.1 hypothetical protein [Spirochaetota bacterium]
MKSFCRLAPCVLIALPLFIAPPAPAGDSPLMGILRFRAAGASGETLSAAYHAMTAAARKDRLYAAPRRDAVLLAYAYETGNTIPAASLRRYAQICARLRCTHLLLGRIIARDRALTIEAKVYSAADRAYLCTISEPVTATGLNAASDRVVRRASLFVQGKLPVVSGLNVSRGASFDRVTLSWLCNYPDAVFTITRSYFERGPAVPIGETKVTSFSDMTAEPGIKCWYAITPSRGGAAGMPVTGYGYRKPPNPRGLTVDEMLGPRTRPWPPEPATEEERARQKLHLELLDKYYESYFMASFIVMVGRMYINSGDLLAYRDFRSYTWDPANRTVFFARPGVLTIKFYSKRFFRFVRDIYNMGIPFEDLLPRLISNAILFCVRSGESEVREPSGRVRYLPTMEAVGMSTEYVRDYEKWKSHSVVFATSDENLYKKVREAESKGY